MRLISITAFIAAVFCSLLIGSAQAKEAAPMAADPVLEERMMAIARELRCLVCQNQNIADSHAELAIDLKNQVREMLVAGKTDKEIIDYMVQRYGDFVRYRPPVNPATYFLWFGPFVLFGGGLLLLYINLKNRRKKLEQVEKSLSEEQIRRAEELLRQDAGDRK